jgi:cytochrome c oxidase subunit 1
MSKGSATPPSSGQLSFYQARGRYPGILGWLFTTDHKRIGLLYLWSILSFFAVGVCFGVLMRLELIAPGKTIVEAKTYNAFFTLHGVIMIFLFIIPSIPATFGNFLLPLMIGARDVSFPRLNLLSWYCYMFGALLAVVAMFSGGGPPDTGWTFYAPYSTQTSTNVTLAVLAAFVIGMSSILTGLNFVTTIHRLRAPGMSWFRMPLFVWSLYATAWIQVLATPIIGITLILVVFDRVFNVGLFDPAKGGDPLLYQHLFWIYSHPAVYVMILPAMGVVSEIIPTFAQKKIFGYKFIAFSSLAIASIGSLVWGHHMFTSGISDAATVMFSLLTFFVAIPSAIKVFNWVATLYRGSIDFRPPLMFCLFFVFQFMIGGLTGMLLAALGPDVAVHDTHFVVAHFHYTMFGGAIFAFFGALHFWFPKMFGRMYNEKWAFIGGSVLFIGFNFMFFSMFIVGFMGMPRRYYDYLPKFHTPNLAATIGSWILVTGLLIMFHNLFRSMRRGPKAPGNPWHGATLDWQTPSPPPHENFAEIPTVTGGPYEFPPLPKDEK